MVSEPLAEPGLLPRFTATERVVHWVHAVGFAALLGTGLVLYVPALADTLGGRPEAKAAHLTAAIGWLTALALTVLLGNRPALRATRRDVEYLDGDDWDWLRRHRTPAGRFNAGQKLHTALQSAFATLFLATGVLLWLGERVTMLRLPGTIVVHDVVAYVAVVLLLGHLWLALLWPPTRHSMRGITLGTVRAAWARQHHPRWVDEHPQPFPSSRPTRRLIVIALLCVAAAAGATAYVIHDARGDSAGRDVPLTSTGH